MMQRRTTFVSMAVTLGALPLLWATQADAQVFTDRAAWNTAAGGSVTENFETVPLGALAPGTTGVGQVSVTIDAAVFGLPAVRDEGLVNGSQEIDGYITFPGVGGPTYMTINFPTPITAWGADFVDTTSGGKLVAEMSENTYQFKDYLGVPGDGFLGIVSDTPFSSVTLTKVNPAWGEQFSMDNLSFHSNALATPEPSAIVSGLGVAISFGLSLGRRRRKAARSRN